MTVRYDSHINWTTAGHFLLEVFHASLSIDWGKRRLICPPVLREWLQPRGWRGPWLWNEGVSETCHIKMPRTKACTYTAVDNACRCSISTMNLAVAHFDRQLQIWGYDYIFLSKITKATCDFLEWFDHFSLKCSLLYRSVAVVTLAHKPVRAKCRVIDIDLIVLMLFLIGWI